MSAPLRKLLIANRGEIAVRIIRTCRELGVATVAVYSEADRCAPHVQLADEAHSIGPAPSRESYLRGDRILDVARRTSADGVHPGYGFLSENAGFAKACADAGVTFVGPPPGAIEAMGEKTRARERMTRAGVPVVPGTVAPLSSLEEAMRVSAELGFPVMLKAAGGGGGKGMRRVESAEAVESAWRAARSEASSSFGNDAVYVEKYLEEPHHVEIQVFADAHGHCVHLGERECSAQRRNQKVVEETPSPILTPELRARMGEVAVRAARAVGYVGAGTVEFLVDAKRNFYFLEMNTRLQVEHPVTEWVTGLDLVALQLRVAGGEPLPFDVAPTSKGHSIEARVYAEDPARGFMPSPGKITWLRTPSGPNVRDDSGVYAGYEVPSHYDPMVSKLSVWAPTRDEAIARLLRALREYGVGGITTNLGYVGALVDHPDFRSGNYDTGFLSRRHEELISQPNGDELLAIVAAAIDAERRAEQLRRPADSSAAAGALSRSPWRWGPRHGR